MISNSREVKLFRNNKSQALRIPVDFEIPGDTAIIWRDGDRLIIEPVRKSGLLGLLDSWKTGLDEFPEIEDAPITPEDIFS